eukprot:jgi/Chlat1/5416/Chrsp35S05225
MLMTSDILTTTRERRGAQHMNIPLTHSSVSCLTLRGSKRGCVRKRRATGIQRVHQNTCGCGSLMLNQTATTSMIG